MMPVGLEALIAAIIKRGGCDDLLGYEQLMQFAEAMWRKTEDNMFVMMAVHYSCIFNEVVPEWAAQAFHEAYWKVASKQASSWDEVFGRPVKKHGRLPDQRQQHLLAPKVWAAICEILDREPTARIETEVFDRVGADLGIAHSTVGKLWAQCPFREAYWQTSRDRVKSK